MVDFREIVVLAIFRKSAIFGVIFGPRDLGSSQTLAQKWLKNGPFFGCLFGEIPFFKGIPEWRPILTHFWGQK